MDPATLGEEGRAAQGIRRLPASLDEALDALAADTVLTSALGPALLSGFMGVKRLEARLFAERDVEYELAQHLYAF